MKRRVLYAKIEPRDYRKSQDQLKKELKEAEKEENYERCAQLRDLIYERKG